jgi:hypothetical protein
MVERTFGWLTGWRRLNRNFVDRPAKSRSGHDEMG